MQKPYATNRQHHQLWNYVDKAAATYASLTLQKKAFCNTLLLIVCVHLLHQNCKSRSTRARSRRLHEGGIPNAELIAILIANYLALFISC